MQLISLTVTKRNGEVKSSVSTGFDVNDIVVPVRNNGVSSYFDSRMLKGTPVESRNNAKASYEVSETLSTIESKTILVIKLTVNKRKNVVFDTSEEMVFIKSRMSESIVPDGTGSKFFYNEDGDPEQVEYFVDEDVSYITTHNSTSGGGITDVTYAEAAALIASDQLIKGSKYKITDRGDNGIILDAISANEFSREGIRLMLCPLTYRSTTISSKTWLGVFNSLLTPSIGDLTIWGGQVWENANGNVGAINDEYSLNAEWQLKTKAANPAYYTELQMQVLYDFTNDWIEKQWDDKGNLVGIDFNLQQNTYGLPVNPCDISDWNFASALGSIFFNNKCFLGFYSNFVGNGYYHNNSCGKMVLNSANGIYYNTVYNNIMNNTCAGGNINHNNAKFIVNNVAENGIYENNSPSGIQNNIVDSITKNSVNEIINNELNMIGSYGIISQNTGFSINNCLNAGNITSNTVNYISNLTSTVKNVQNNTGYNISSLNITGNISYNTISEISSISDTSIKGIKYNQAFNETVNNSYELNITGLTNIDLSKREIQLGLCKYIVLKSSNATETINTISNIDITTQVARSNVFSPKGALTITFVNSVSLKCEGGINAVVDGSNEDWVEFGINKQGGVVKQINIGTY